MTMTLSGDGTITGLVAGGLPNATVTADDLAAGAALNSVSDGVFFRNRIINGDMRIDQRNAGAAVTTNLAFSVDRFQAVNTTDGAFSLQQDTDAPTGFNNSIKYTTTTEDASLTTTQQTGITHKVEGFNISDAGFGTANAKTLTLSFWVRSSLTGTFGGSFRNGGANRSYPYTYSISAADTWEYKTVTFTADTTGTYSTTNGTGVTINFSLGSGPDRSGTAGAWNANNNTSATGAVSVIGTLNATWYITGVQLEVGSVATPFERRPYGTELSLCQRYFYRITGSNVYSVLSSAGQGSTSTSAVLGIPTKVSMRATPSLSSSGNLAITQNGGAGFIAVTSTAIYSSSTAETPMIQAIVASGVTAGYCYFLHGNNDATASVSLSSEL